MICLQRYAGHWRTPPPCLPDLLVWLELPHFTQARIWIVDGKPEKIAQAIGLLTDLEKMAENMGSLWRVIECLIWLACALYRQGKRTTALERLKQAVQLAQSGRFFFLFIEAGPLVAEMLGQIDSRETEFVQQILAGFRSKQKISVSNFLLTRREVEVLHLLNEHLSEREIAARLSVSPDTVKKHCYHIFNKLGVNRRRDALAIAKESGILR